MDYQPPPCVTLTGQLIRRPGTRRAVLIVDAPPDAGVEGTFYCGPVWLYGALPFLYQDDYLLPQFAFDDFRRAYHGEAALSFLDQKGASFPRADVAGRRVSTGAIEEVFLKQLDVAGGLAVLAFDRPDACTPLATLDGLLWVTAEGAGLRPLQAGDSRVPGWLRRAVCCAEIAPADLERLWDMLAAL